jgi:hypothetical protein
VQNPAGVRRAALPANEVAERCARDRYGLCVTYIRSRQIRALSPPTVSGHEPLCRQPAADAGRLRNAAAERRGVFSQSVPAAGGPCGETKTPDLPQGVMRSRALKIRATGSLGAKTTAAGQLTAARSMTHFLLHKIPNSVSSEPGGSSVRGFAQGRVLFLHRNY